MIEQLKTIRAALDILRGAVGHEENVHTADIALTALNQLEAMVGEPVAWMGIPVMPGRYKEAVFCSDKDLASQWDYSGHTGLGRLIVTPLYAAPPAQQYEAGDVASAAAQGFRDGVASVTQQPPKLEDIEQYRLQMAGISTAAIGYWKEGDSIHPDYDTLALRDVAKLYAKYDALYKAQQPQARPDFTDEWAGYLKDGETPFERFLRERKDMQSVLKLYQRVLEENERLKAQQPQAEPTDSMGIPLSCGKPLCSPGDHHPLCKLHKKPQTEAVPKLEVFYGAMPESCGRTNWTAILHRGDMTEGHTIDLSEYPHRVRYEADRVRWLIGELDKEPFILDYDADEKTPCHLCGGTGELNGKPCPGLNFRGTVHHSEAPQQAEAVPSDVVRDAERYRWLRNESWAGYNTGRGTPSVYTVDGAGNRRMMLAEEAMDEAIDAAIAQQKGGV